MARRWLLGILTGVGLTFASAATAGAQELPDALAVETEVLDAEVEADGETPSARVTTGVDAEVEDAGTAVTRETTVEASPSGPSVSSDGPVEVAGEEVPVPQVPADEGDDETSTGPGGSAKAAAGSNVSPAAEPRPAGPARVDTGNDRRVATTMSADRAAARAGLVGSTGPAETDELAPVVAPAEEALPLVAAAAPSSPTVTDLGLPILDTTPTVPGLLRLLAGLLVVGAAATWRTVRAELA